MISPRPHGYNKVLQADSKPLHRRIIFINFNPPLHLLTFPSFHSYRSVPEIAPPPSIPPSLLPPSLLSFPGQVYSAIDRCFIPCGWHIVRNRWFFPLDGWLCTQWAFLSKVFMEGDVIRFSKCVGCGTTDSQLAIVMPVCESLS